MKKLLFLFCLWLLSSASFAQSAEKAMRDTSRSEKAQLVFLFQNDQFYYTLPYENKKNKLDSLTRQPINKVIDSVLAKNNWANSELTVIIEGDGVMQDQSFQTLLETLLDKKIYLIRIRTSLYEAP